MLIQSNSSVAYPNYDWDTIRNCNLLVNKFMSLEVMLGIEDPTVAREMFYQNHTDYSQSWKVIIISLWEVWSAGEKSLCLPSYVKSIDFVLFHIPTMVVLEDCIIYIDGETLMLPSERVLRILFLFKCFWSKLWYCLTLRPEDKVRLCNISENS